MCYVIYTLQHFCQNKCVENTNTRVFIVLLNLFNQMAVNELLNRKKSTVFLENIFEHRIMVKSHQHLNLCSINCLTNQWNLTDQFLHIFRCNVFSVRLHHSPNVCFAGQEVVLNSSVQLLPHLLNLRSDLLILDGQGIPFQQVLSTETWFSPVI